MSHPGRAAKSLLPAFGVATAGVTLGAAGLWSWRRKAPTPEGRDFLEDAKKAEPAPPIPLSAAAAAAAATATATPATAAPATAAPTAAATAIPPRTGPMVAVYLDESSVEKLHREYPGTSRGRLRKVVLQYNPTDEQRGLYESHFGGLATVQLTGEASSADRRALMASVSLSGKSVEPQSLSCAVDVTPGDFGGGPLGSAVLLEQVKQAGGGAAAKDVPWKGSLPPLSAHGRDFPSEDGCFDKLDAPLTVTGSVCRADWVDGTTGRCRTVTEGGDKRTDGWTPQGCIICNTLEASPCRDIYKRFDSLSRRIVVLEPPKDPKPSDDPSAEAKGGVSQKPGGGDEEEPTATHNGNGEDRVVPAPTGAGAEKGDNVEAPAVGGDGGKSDGVSDVVDAAAVDAAAAEREQARRPVVGEDTAVEPEKGEKGAGGREKEEGGGAVGGGGGGTSEKQEGGEGEKEEEGEEERLRREELEQLNTEREGVALELLYCTELHNVFQDYNADDGMTPGAEGFEDDDGVDAGEGASPSSEASSNSEANDTAPAAAPPVAPGGGGGGGGEGGAADSGSGDGVSAKN